MTQFIKDIYKIGAQIMIILKALAKFYIDLHKNPETDKYGSTTGGAIGKILFANVVVFFIVIYSLITSPFLSTFVLGIVLGSMDQQKVLDFLNKKEDDIGA